MRIPAVFLCLLAPLFLACAERGPIASAPSPVIVEYSNPIIKGSAADPHVIRVDDKYYMYATTHQRGYDVYVSDDLVQWENKGLAFDDPRGGVWAPDVFHNKNGDGKFYLYYTDNDPRFEPGPTRKQIGVAVADSPLGPFVDKGPLIAPAIDAHMFQDDDGKFYLYYVSFARENQMLVQPMKNPLTPEGEPKLVLRPTEPWEMISGKVTEAPWMLKRDGKYYLMYSGNGADHFGYGIAYATSDSPMGPFEKYPGNPIGHYSDTVFGPGHHSVVEGPDGELWMIYHQKFNNKLNYRRFLALDPIWFDDKGVIHVRLTREEDVKGR